MNLALAPTADQPATFNVGQAAFFLGVSAATVNRLLRANTLPKLKIGRRTMVRRADCMTLIAGQKPVMATGHSAKPRLQAQSLPRCAAVPRQQLHRTCSADAAAGAPGRPQEGLMHSAFPLMQAGAVRTVAAILAPLRRTGASTLRARHMPVVGCSRLAGRTVLAAYDERARCPIAALDGTSGAGAALYAQAGAAGAPMRRTAAHELRQRGGSNCFRAAMPGRNRCALNPVRHACRPAHNEKRVRFMARNEKGGS